MQLLTKHQPILLWDGGSEEHLFRYHVPENQQEHVVYYPTLAVSNSLFSFGS
jgi:hypothetical protein